MRMGMYRLPLQFQIFRCFASMFVKDLTHIITNRFGIVAVRPKPVKGSAKHPSLGAKNPLK